MLELSDQSGATLVTTIELVPCGLVMESVGGYCLDTFCQNVIREIFQMLAEKTEDRLYADELKRQSEAALQSQAQQPQVARRTYYRQVATEKPQIPR